MYKILTIFRYFLSFIIILVGLISFLAIFQPGIGFGDGLAIFIIAFIIFTIGILIMPPIWSKLSGSIDASKTAKLKENTKQLREQQAEANNKLVELNSDIKKKQANLDSLKFYLAEKQSSLDSLKTDIEHQQAVLENANSETEEIKNNKIMQEQIALNDAKRAVKEIENRKVIREQEVNQIESRIADKNSELDSIQNQVKEAKKDLQEANNKITELNKKISDPENTKALQEIEQINQEKQQVVSFYSSEIFQNFLDYEADNELAKIDGMSGLDFEKYVADLLKRIGYTNVATTSASGDNGLDVLAHNGNTYYGIQCKLYTAPVGNSAVQEAYSGGSYYKTDKNIVITNNYFTPNAVQAAETMDVDLWDRDKLKELILENYNIFDEGSPDTDDYKS
ncbi:Mrr family endonuclease [Secundilactobacillus pentosiphilus]|uniref:Mrr family endonuclease n=1 Tax=Secundilactobacillus pentosiphilus TaxID=1714682 RepID=A0A1Z5ISY1_9LACO|nr:restriction endonuclease [Secundilactobacillus pentosiphilus]GAX04873.1 Mrr family endonuclease [Secundilactobacillus pentosiphilus]